MVTKPTGRPRGRPSIPLRDDPERYVLTWFEAVARLNKGKPGFSRNGLALAVVMAWKGELVNESDNIARWLNGSGPVAFRATKFRGTEGSKEARHASAFHPAAHDFVRKAHRFSAMVGTMDDLLWWTTMVPAWSAVLAEQDPILAQTPALWCRIIGEADFYNHTLSRFVEARFGGRPLPKFTLPDFNPHDDA